MTTIEFKVKTSKKKVKKPLQRVLNAFFVLGALMILKFVLDFDSPDSTSLAGGDNTGEPNYTILFIGMAICLIAYAVLYLAGLRFKPATLTFENDQIMISCKSTHLMSSDISELQLEPTDQESKHPELKLNYTGDLLHIRFQSLADRKRFLKQLERG